MEINLSKYAGFCDGVNRAYNIVQKIVQNSEIKKPIYVLGSLVHNDDVVESIDKIGVRKIDFKGKIGEVVDKLDKNIGTLVITAHGIGPKIFEIAKKKGINIVDTTCPKVIRAQRLAEASWKKSRQIIIIGKKKHKETMGIFRWTRKRAVIVENEADVVNLNLAKDGDLTIISQTTQNKDRVNKLVKLILEKYPRAEILDTVCETTKNRQREAKDLAIENDVVLVIGSPNSSNSTELWNIAKKNNTHSYFIERVENIKNKWLENCQTVGVTAGASTPQWIIAEVQKYLTKI